MKYYIGIDGGLDGAIGVITIHGYISIVDIPTGWYETGKKRKRVYNVPALNNILTAIKDKYYPDIICYLEKSLPMWPIKTKGKSSSFVSSSRSFVNGENFGIMKTLLFSNHIPIVIVPPKDWQKSFWKPVDKGTTKDKSIIYASKIYPDAELKTPRGRLLDGRSDALLIAAHGMRIHKNG